MTRILLTNDDGIHSDGLIKLEEALREVGDVYVVAPASEMSGASHSLTLSRPLRIRQIDERHWTVDGTPTDCVTLALHKILPPRRAARHLRLRHQPRRQPRRRRDLFRHGRGRARSDDPRRARHRASARSRARSTTSRTPRASPSRPCGKFWPKGCPKGRC